MSEPERRSAEDVLRAQMQAGEEERSARPLLCEDPDLQAYALRESCEEHPVLYQISDLARKAANSSPSWSQIDRMRCVVDEMVRAGLVRRVGDDDPLVIPTLSALHFNALLHHFR